MTPDQEKQFFRDGQFTLKGRIFHPALLAPKANKEGTKTNYNVQFAFRPEENQEVLAKLNAFLTTAYQTWYSTVPMQFFVNPIKKFETYVKMNGQPNADYLKGHYWVNAATGVIMPPQVVKQGPMGTFIQLTEADEAEVYSGANAVIQISFYKIKAQKQGLSTNVNAVMIMGGGEKVSGGTSMDVNKIFGGFASDMGMAQQFGTPAAPAAAPANNFAAPAWPPQAAPVAAPTSTPGPVNNGGGFV